MGQADRDTEAPNLARHQLVSAQQVAYNAADPFALVTIPTQFSEFAEALEIVIAQRPTPLAAVPAAALFVVNAPAPSQALLEAGEFVLPGCDKSIPMPAWVNPVTVALRMVQADAWATPISGTVQVLVYRMDRCTRKNWRGPN